MVPSWGRLLVTIGGAALLLATGCGSASAATKTGSGGGGGTTNTIGVLYDITGPGAPGELGLAQGVEAGIKLAASEGYKIRYVQADGATNPTSTLAAAQKLVDEDHVKAIIEFAVFIAAAEPFFHSQDIPLLGLAQDQSFQVDHNEFGILGNWDTRKVSPTDGVIYKKLGVTNVGIIAYSGSPVSKLLAENFAKSAQLQGVKVGYLNYDVPYGSTNFGAVALAMKTAGINGIDPLVTSQFALPLQQALTQLGVKLKMAVSAGDPGDVLNAGRAAIKAEDGDYFITGFEPPEMNTPATKELAKYMRQAGVAGQPTMAAQYGYVGTAIVLSALRKAGANASPSSLSTALENTHRFDPVGLVGGHTIDFSDRSSTVQGVDNCSYVTQLVGNHIVLPGNGLDPICMPPVPGLTVAP